MADMVTKLSDAMIQQRLQELVNWQLECGALQRTFSLPTFPSAIFFVNAIAHLAELGEHHPDIEVLYNKVVLRFVTHSAGGITEKDVTMAHKVDELWKAMS